MRYFFLALKAYGGRRERLFVPELYDLYWETSLTPHLQWRETRYLFDKLVQIRNTLVHKISPKDEEEWGKVGTEAMENLREVMSHFHFLHNYDLIRVVNPVGEEYEYDRYTGQVFTHHQESLRSKEKIQAG